MPLAEPAGAVTATIVAVATGLGAIVTAIGGVLLAIRTVRSRERQAAKKELDQVVEEMSYLEDLLNWERARRVDAATYVHDLLVIMSHFGMAPPPAPEPGPPRPLRPPHLKAKEDTDERPDAVGGTDLALPGDSVHHHRPTPGDVRDGGGGGAG